MYYWVNFIGHSSGTVEAKDAESASLLAKEITGKEVSKCSQIPYPASPKLHKIAKQKKLALRIIQRIKILMYFVHLNS